MATDGAGAAAGKRRVSAWRVVPWVVAAALLATPLVAMQFTDEVDWGPGAFVLLGVLLTAVCGAFELAARRTENLAYRAATGIAVVTAFLLIWVNLAVGIIGDEDEGANLLYLGVIVIGLLGAAAARGRPTGMARALAAAAAAQAAVAGLILVAGWGLRAAILTSFFAAAWLVSAGLFRRAALN